MTDNLVEAVARAIYTDEAPVLLDEWGEESPAEWDDLHDTEWVDQGYDHWLPPKTHYYTQARAAVETTMDWLIAEEEAKFESRRNAGESSAALVYLSRVTYLRAKKEGALNGK